VVALLFGLVTFIPEVAVCVRRLHDIGKSGWYLAGALILAVILAFAIGLAIAFKSNVVAIVSMPLFMILILAFYIVPMLKGQPGENKWGPTHNEVNNVSEKINENTIE
jgi:uncharacterized membrane protein YhaH (DUF805 family)